MTSCIIFVSGTGLSGGLNVIFEHAISARENGVAVSFALRDKIDPRSEVAWHRISRLSDFEWLSYAELGRRQFDIAMATYWPTCFEIWRANAGRWTYFVQSVESRFPDPGDLIRRLGAESTYRMPVGMITEAAYVQQYLSNIHGQEAELALNGISKEVFQPDGERIGKETNGLRVVVEGALEPERKGTIAAIELSRQAGVAEIWLLTLTAIRKYPGVDRVFSAVPHSEVGKIYRSCDVLVKLSRVEGMFGPPLEMFHCGGTAITYNVTGHEHYIEHGYNALVAPMLDRERVVGYLRDLQRWPELLSVLKKGALATAARWPSWQESSRVFWRQVLKAAERGTATQSNLEQLSRLFHESCRLAWRPPQPDMTELRSEIEALARRVADSCIQVAESRSQMEALNSRVEALLNGKISQELDTVRSQVAATRCQAQAALDHLDALSHRLDAVLKQIPKTDLRKEVADLARQVCVYKAEMRAIYDSRIWKTLTAAGRLFLPSRNRH